MKPKFDHKVHRPYGPWISAANTDIRKTFAAERKRLAKKKSDEQAKAAVPLKKIVRAVG